jgi:hypothetical protein
MAADAGTVAAVTTNTEGIQIVVIRHANDLLTVYTHVEDLTVSKDSTVARGQQIGVVRPGNPPSCTSRCAAACRARTRPTSCPDAKAQGFSPKTLGPLSPAPRPRRPARSGDELPRHPPRPRAPRGLPFDRLGPELPSRSRSEGLAIARIMRRYSSCVQGWKPEPQPEAVDSDTFSSTASDGLMAVLRSFSIMSRGIRCRRFEVA